VWVGMEPEQKRALRGVQVHVVVLNHVVPATNLVTAGLIGSGVAEQVSLEHCPHPNNAS
jgi:hypothetical protein